ncbi:unnamed protein product [Mytilus edulis]|uniref:Reverse transcriptase domain-containing protein n=1 Tax=Mytilus edulis TaxID=6550 RepID=A0A8S3QC23_MYTED|nr:unnamed protein product [Mytilus edulis]
MDDLLIRHELNKTGASINRNKAQAIRRMMSRRGFTVIAYLDDFFICERTKQRCALCLRVLIDLLRKLGFAISWSKVFDPCQKLVFLGVEIDSTTLELRLPLTKLEQLRAELAEFKQRKHVSKKQLQSLAGKLNWASSVVHGGRVFLRRIIDGITKLKHDWHKMRLGGDILHDIHWWYNFMSTFNGKSLLLNTDPVTSVYTDACKTGAGGIFGTDWFYVNWKEDFPFAQSLHINEQEAFAVALAAKRWAKCWQNRRVYIFCDNSSTVSCINKCTSKNKLLMTFLRELFWLSASYNFHLVAIHLPGKDNDMADAVSRLHDLKLCKFFMKECLPAPKSNLFVPTLAEFDAGKHLSRQDIVFQTSGTLHRIRKSKTIQFANRLLEIPLPRIPNSPLCPSQALLLHVKMIPAVSCPSPAFLYISKGTTVPLTYSTFLQMLKHSLSQLELDTSGYSGHSFRRGGATFALECGVSSDLIQAQGIGKVRHTKVT